MTTDIAERLQETWNARYGDKVCLHARMIESLESTNGRLPHLVVCRECGVIIPDPRQQAMNKRLVGTEN